MKQIFDWLREQMRLSLNEPQYFHEGEDFYNGIIHAEELINEAEAKWEADCCEWKPHIADKDIVEAHDFLHIKDHLFDWEFCPYCGKPIKISEVE